jgi:hypothetical protein
MTLPRGLHAAYASAGAMNMELVLVRLRACLHAQSPRSPAHQDAAGWQGARW